MKRLLPVLLLFIIASCEKKNTDSTFKGRIVHASDSTPYANVSFILYEEGSKGFSNKNYKNTVPFTTDASGAFEAKMATESGGVVICWPNKPSKSSADAIAGTLGRDGGSEKGVFDFGTIYYK